MPVVKALEGVKRLEAVWRIEIGDYPVTMAWSPDGLQLAVASSGGPVMLVDGLTGKMRRTFSGHANGSLALAWSSGGSYLASGGQDGKSRVWEPDGASPVCEMDGGSTWVEHLVWSRDQNHVAVASGKVLRIWEAKGKRVGEAKIHPSTISGLDWHALRREWISMCYGHVMTWSADASKRKLHFNWKGSLIALCQSPNGRHIACGTQDAAVHLWDFKTGKDLEMTGYPLKVRELAWDRNSLLLGTGGGSDITLWSFSGRGPAGSEPIVLRGHQGILSDIKFEPNGAVLASGAQEGMIYFWDVESERKLGYALHKTGDPVTRIAWNPHRPVLAVGYASGAIALWPRP